MLSNKQIKQLKALANTSKHKYQIGKDALDENVFKLLNNALTAHELIKVYFSKNIAEKRETLTEAIIKETSSYKVAEIGHTIILYRENPKKENRIKLF